MIDDARFIYEYETLMEARRLEKLRKRLKKEEKKKENKLSRIALTVEQKIERRRERRRLAKQTILKNKQERRNKIMERKKLLKQQGWQEGYVRQDISIRNRRPRDLELCKEVYDRIKAGFTIRELSEIYKRPYIWVHRYKKEYKAYLEYLSLKGKNGENTNITPN